MKALLLALIGLTACGSATAATKVEHAEYRYTIGFKSHTGDYTYSVYCDRLSNSLIYVSDYNWRDLVYAGPCQ